MTCDNSNEQKGGLVVDCGAGWSRLVQRFCKAKTVMGVHFPCFIATVVNINITVKLTVLHLLSQWKNTNYD